MQIHIYIYIYILDVNHFRIITQFIVSRASVQNARETQSWVRAYNIAKHCIMYLIWRIFFFSYQNGTHLWYKTCVLALYSVHIKLYFCLYQFSSAEMTHIWYISFFHRWVGEYNDRIDVLLSRYRSGRQSSYGLSDITYSRLNLSPQSGRPVASDLANIYTPTCTLNIATWTCAGFVVC